MALPCFGKASVSNHDRGDSGNSLIYPVVSRRSGGLSLGVNLFPDRKTCNFDCPYCEVLPFKGRQDFSVASLELALHHFFDVEYPAYWSQEPLRDICISGNGEPTMSPHLGEVLDLCAQLRSERLGGREGGANIVIITNSTGFLKPETAAILARAAFRDDLVIWAKLDGVDQDWFTTMSGSSYDYRLIIEKLVQFSSHHPVIVQTMLCSSDNHEPNAADITAYAAALSGMLAHGAKIREVHLYTKARPDFGDKTKALSDAAMRKLAAIPVKSLPIPVRVFGKTDEIRIDR